MKNYEKNNNDDYVECGASCHSQHLHSPAYKKLVFYLYPTTTKSQGFSHIAPSLASQLPTFQLTTSLRV